MEKMISYLCGNIETLKRNIGVSANKFKRQGRTNRGFALLFILGGIYIYTTEGQNAKNKEKIETLTKEVEELKKMKGE